MIFTCNEFNGFYPVGAAAVICAENVEEAVRILEDDLERSGLPQVIKPEQLVSFTTNVGASRILVDGNY